MLVMLKANDNWEHFEAVRVSDEYDREPEFDRNRVIWDVDYRHRVIALLKDWRETRQAAGQTAAELQGAA